MNPKSPNAKILRLSLLLAFAAALLGQSEVEPYFALASFQTFKSNGKPSVALSAFNVDSVEFRVYRVEDALKFFAQLEDSHQFGAITPRPPRERTLLENIRSWKRSLRANIRRSLRA